MVLRKLLSGGVRPVIEKVKKSSQRKAKAATRLRYYQDEQSEDTLNLIKKRWSSPEDFRLFQVNIVRKITNKRATVYRKAPTRTAVEFDQEKLDALYQGSNINMVLKRASRMTKLLKAILIQVGWKDGQPTLSIVTPNILDVDFDGDPQNLTRVIITHPGEKENETEYSVWTPDQYTRLDYRGAEIPLPSNTDNVNPYGVLPFVPCFDRWPDDQFFVPGGDDLIEAQQAINVSLANLWRAVELQAHGQAWASGIPASDAIKTGPDRAISLPTDGKFGFAAPNAPITDILEAIQFVLRQTAAANDLSADVFDLEGKAESAAAKIVEQTDLQEARQDDVDL